MDNEMRERIRKLNESFINILRGGNPILQVVTYPQTRVCYSIGASSFGTHEFVVFGVPEKPTVYKLMEMAITNKCSQNTDKLFEYLDECQHISGDVSNWLMLKVDCEWLSDTALGWSNPNLEHYVHNKTDCIVLVMGDVDNKIDKTDLDNGLVTVTTSAVDGLKFTGHVITKDNFNTLIGVDNE